MVLHVATGASIRCSVLCAATGAVELRNSLQGLFELLLPSTLVFDYPTITALVDFLTTTLQAKAPQATGNNPAGSSRTSPTADTSQAADAHPAVMARVLQTQPARAAVGILAIETRAPANALDSLSGADATSVVPISRWDVNRANFGTERPAVRFASLLDNVAAFDAGLFGISTSEAVVMDPQQRLVLECTAAVITSANSNNTSSSNCGVFMGVSSSDYSRLTDKHSAGLSAYSATSSALSVAAGRVSYIFGFKGPCMSVDTACSSSLVSLHSAVHALRAAECSSAVSAGVNLTLMPDTPAKFQEAGMLSSSGRCQTLDQAADGYGR